MSALLSFHYNKSLLFAMVYFALEIVNTCIKVTHSSILLIFDKDSHNEYIYVIFKTTNDFIISKILF